MISPLRTHPWHAISIVLLATYAALIAFGTSVFLLFYPATQSAFPWGVALGFLAAVGCTLASIVTFFLRKPTQGVILAALGALVLPLMAYSQSAELTTLPGVRWLFVAPLWAAISAWTAAHAAEDDIRSFAKYALMLTPIVWAAATWMAFPR